MTDRPASDLIHNLGGARPCPRELVKDLTNSEVAALHAFKHEVAAAGFRLYQHVSAAKADAVVRHFVKSMLETH